MIDILSWVVFTLGVTGCGLIAYKGSSCQVGWICFMAASFISFYIASQLPLYGIMATQVTYFCIEAFGLYRARKHKHDKTS